MTQHNPSVKTKTEKILIIQVIAEDEDDSSRIITHLNELNVELKKSPRQLHRENGHRLQEDLRCEEIVQSCIIQSALHRDKSCNLINFGLIIRMVIQ